MTPCFPRLYPLIALLAVSLVARGQAQSLMTFPVASSTWKVSSGASWRTIGRVSFGQSSQGVGFLAGLNNTITTSGGGFPPGIYDNGFVLPDTNGGLTTSNFGWNSSTAITQNGQNETFTFILTQNTSQTLTEFLGGTPAGAGSTDTLNGLGTYVRFESPAIALGHNASLSFDFGYAWSRMNIAQSQTAFAGLLRTTTNSVIVSDTYGGADFGVSPGIPYTGSPAGGPEIPLAPSNSTAQQVEVRRAVIVDSEFNRSFGLDLQTLSLGPRITWQTADGRFQAGFSTGLALNLASWNATITETLRERGGRILQTWTSQHSGNKLLPGWYLELSAAARLNEAWLATIAARYDWAPSLHANAGASDFTLDLSGWTVLSGFTYQF